MLPTLWLCKPYKGVEKRSEDFSLPPITNCPGSETLRQPFVKKEFLFETVRSSTQMLDIANIGSSGLLPVPSKLVEPPAYANDVYL